ncbi:MAG: ABC transporter permease subunit [Pseudonocardiaceae bacterium]|nr:ABC transporter permease subunit [Pseudonocardiaceae bacterium]
MLLRSLNRALGYVGVLLAAIALNFALPRLAPGDAVDYLLPPEVAGEITAAERERVLSQYGLGEPAPVQFWRYLTNLATGDLGVSVRYARPVTEVLGDRVGWTALLVGGALVLSTVFGTLLGFYSAWRRGSTADAGTLTAVMVVDAMPPFFLGLLFILLFSVQLEWLPIFGALPASGAGGIGLVLEAGERLILPLVTLTLGYLGSVYLVARASLVGELQEDYVLMAEAKGLDARGVRRHAQRNALIPIATITLVGLGTLVGGAAVVETVFSYPGLGRLIYESVLARDYPLLQGAFLLLAVGVVLANLVADLLYPLLDPRVRRPGARVG